MSPVKVGDRIQSFNVTRPVDPTRRSYVGRVTELRVDPMDGVTYVHYQAESVVCNGKVIKPCTEEMRAPQNGTPTMMGGPCDGIEVLGDKDPR